MMVKKFFIAVSIFLTVCVGIEAMAQDSDASSSSKLADMQGPFYFVDESPIQIINMLEAMTGKTILQPAGLPNIKINFVTKRAMQREDAICAFESLLSLNGIAILPMGDNFLKAVSTVGVNTQSPQFLTGSALDMVPSQNFYSKLYEFKYLDIETTWPIFQPLLSPAGVGSVSIFVRSNSLFITDTLINHQRLEKLIDKIDIPMQIREDIGFIQLKNTSAEDIKKRLTTGVQSPLFKRYFDRVVIDSDIRTNQIIIFAPKGSLENIKSFIKSLDIEAAPLTKSKVFYLKQGTAKEMNTVLNQIVDKQKAAATRNRTSNAATSNRTSTTTAAAGRTASANPTVAATSTRSAAVATAPAVAGIGDTGGIEFSDYISVVPDERSNSIVVYGSDTDIKQVGDLIEKLDIILLQVKIEVIITEVVLTDNEVSGLETFGFGMDFTKDGTGNRISGNTSGPAIKDTSTKSFTFNWKNNAFETVFNVAKKNEKVRILSTPTITTTHNKQSKITVAEKYPTIEGITTDSTGTATRSTVTKQDIGIILTVTPLIGDNGVVQMDIEQTVQNMTGTVQIDGNDQPIVSTREARSFVSVKDNEVLVLGGLQRIDDTDSDSQVWLLGNIPIIGEIFKPNTFQKKRRELIMFIRPTIVRSTSTSNLLSSDTIQKSDAGESVDQYLKTGKLNTVPETLEERKGKSINWKINHPYQEEDNGESIKIDDSAEGSIRNDDKGNISENVYKPQKFNTASKR